VIWVVFRLVSKIIDRVKLREFDRQMGATFGLAKGVLLCVVITFFAVTLSESLRQLVLKSYSGAAIAKLTRNASPLLPKDVSAVIGKYIDELDHKLDPKTPAETPDEKNAGRQNWKDLSQELEQKFLEEGKKLGGTGQKTN